MNKVTNRMLFAVWVGGIALLVLGLALNRSGVFLFLAGFVVAAFASITYRLRRARAFNDRAAKRRSF